MRDDSTVAVNRRARHEFTIDDTFVIHDVKLIDGPDGPDGWAVLTVSSDLLASEVRTSVQVVEPLAGEKAIQNTKPGNFIEGPGGWMKK